MMTAKHVLKGIKARGNQDQPNNFYSKEHFVWGNEKSLEKVVEISTSDQNAI